MSVLEKRLTAKAVLSLNLNCFGRQSMPAENSNVLLTGSAYKV